MFSVAMRAEEWKRNYPVARKPDIIVTAGRNIDINVRAWDTSSVEAKVVTGGWAVKQIHIDENQENDRIQLKVEPPHVSVSTHTRSVRVELMVPHQSNIKVKSEIGHVTVDGVTGEVQISPGRATKSFVITTAGGAPHIERQ
jgi:DUF4097 and DUF4098 domain-containing protein YvlB